MISLAPRTIAANLSLFLLSASVGFSQNSTAGKTLFASNCAVCHGADANGGELGPPIRSKIPAHTDNDLGRLMHEGLPNKGMPGHNFSEADTGDLVAFLRSLNFEKEDR